MGLISRQWEALANERADELCRALVRMPLMTYKQVGTLLSVGPSIARKIVADSWDRFTVLKYRDNYVSPRYSIATKHLKSVITLTNATFNEWSEREGIQSKRFVRPEVYDRVLSVTELLIQMRLKGVLYDKWNFMWPQIANEGLHAWVERKTDAHRIGVYLLPTKYKYDSYKTLVHTQRGILRRVTQHIQSAETLFLVPAEQYAMSLRILTKLKYEGIALFLLPLETFLNNPELHLNAIIDSDSQGSHTVMNHHQWFDRFPLPGHYQYHALVRVEPDVYRFIEVYASGHIERLQSWLNDNKFGYDVPDTGSIATAWVYAYDNVIAEGLRSVLAETANIVDVKSWPVNENIGDIPEENEDWSIFDDVWGK